MKNRLLILPIAGVLAIIASGCKTTCCTDANKKTATSATPTVAVATTTAPKTQLPTIRIKAGAGAIKDSASVEWLADTGFGGGDSVERPDLSIANTKQPEIYRSEHYAMESFTQKLPNGKYQVKLHFCETFEGITEPGQRVFSFDVEGKTFKDFDVWVKSGGAASAYVETIPVDITDGQLDIKFTAQVENPQINAIEILPRDMTTASNQ
jgi:hypothetical protein